jgi:fatty acid elongase 3
MLSLFYDIVVIGRIYFYYCINYIFKFWELFDTGTLYACIISSFHVLSTDTLEWSVLLVLRGRATPFLHVYHHASTLILCWSQMRAESCMQWIPMIINLSVHVTMYVCH